MMRVVDFTLERVSTPIPSAFSYSNAFRRTEEVFEMQVKFNRVPAQVSSVTSECSIWRSLARVRGNVIIDLGPALNTSKNMFK